MLSRAFKPRTVSLMWTSYRNSQAGEWGSGAGKAEDMWHVYVIIEVMVFSGCDLEGFMELLKTIAVMTTYHAMYLQPGSSYRRKDNLPEEDSSVLNSISKEECVVKKSKGGGSGGAVRDAGGSFGKMEAAREEEYFKRLQKDQIKKLKSHLHEEITHHEESIKQLQQEIDRHKKKIGELGKDETAL